MAAKRQRQGKVDPHIDPIDLANISDDDSFETNYIEWGAPGIPIWEKRWTHPRTGAIYVLGLARSENMSEAALETCFSLIEETSRADYEQSSQKWRPAAKRKEMREPDLRYIVVRELLGENGADILDTEAIRGFVSLMPTYEEGEPVVYCYEIHLKPELHGTGLAGLLMNYLYTVAYNIESVEKVMLTCFLSNTVARRFYHKQGFRKDPISPEPRILRGKTVEPDYVILSLPVTK